MGDYYDYSQHSYCITFGFDQERVYVDCFYSDYKEESTGYFMQSLEASILYNVSSGEFWFKDDDAKLRKESKDIYYQKNVFTKLYDIYLKKKENSFYQYDMHDDIVIGAIGYFVQKQVNYYQLHKMGGANTSSCLLPHFALFLPTSWDDEIREELLRPVFIQNKILTEKDHKQRLLFFTQLETNFRYLQSKADKENERMNTEIKNGKQYIMYGLKFNDDSLALTSSRNGYESDDIHEYQPFKQLHINPKQCDLNADEKTRIQSITMKDIHQDLFHSLEKTFLNQIGELVATHGAKIRTGIITLLNIDERLIKRFDFKYSSYVAWMVFNWLKRFLNAATSENQCLTTFGKGLHPSFKLFWTTILKGNRILIKDTIQLSTKNIPPSVISANRIGCFSGPSISMFDHSKPNYIINIGNPHRSLSENSVKYAYSATGTNECVEKCINYSECDMHAINSFFVQPNMYLKALLRVTDRLKLFMDKNFNEFLDDKLDLFSSKSVKVICLRIKTYLPQLADFFSKKSKEQLKPQNLVVLQQNKYKQLFLLMYFAYLDKTVTEQATQCFGNGWTKHNVGTTLSVEKRVLDEIIGSRKTLQKILVGSGMLQKDEKNKKTVIITQGEGLLPAIQEHIGLNLALKSHYVLAQLSTDYIQISLHQVVKISSPKESAAAVVIQDEIIQIEDVCDALSRHVWRCIESGNQIEYCSLHNKTGSHKTFSPRNYSNVLMLLKQHTIKTLSSNFKISSMDDKTKIMLGEECGCSIHVTARNIIEMGVKSVLQKMTTKIAASLTNINLFGKYEVNFVFIMGDIFNLERNPIMYTIYGQLLQEAYNESIAMKGKDASGFIIQKDIFQLLQPIMAKKPFMYDSFTIGSLYLTARETYGMYVSSFAEKDRLSYDPQLCDVDTKGAHGEDSNMTIIVLQKGQCIPNTGLDIDLDLIFKKSPEYKYGDKRNLVLDFVVVVELVRLRGLGEMTLKDRVYLDDYSYDNVASLAVLCDARIFVSPIRLEIQSINHNSSLRFSVRMIGDGGEYENHDKCVFTREQLSMAYF
ncbi:hypothetical protein INT47_005474 [Mucor saturninus]|uniref:Uncharacterized protein n=1 Tax=Mucor saturninus TaxID=64648 RepID=A0A8H7V885_9FUNG|nr:hypothetical protein INT47_005474 [Mucor saturninus]